MLKQALELNKNKIWKIKIVEDVKKLLQHNASSPHLSLTDSSSHLHSPQSLPYFFLPNPPPCIVPNFDQDLWSPGSEKCSLNDKAHNWLLGNAPMPWAKATQSSGIQTQCCSLFSIRRKLLKVQKELGESLGTVSSSARLAVDSFQKWSKSNRWISVLKRSFQMTERCEILMHPLKQHQEFAREQNHLIQTKVKKCWTFLLCSHKKGKNWDNTKGEGIGFEPYWDLLWTRSFRTDALLFLILHWLHSKPCKHPLHCACLCPTATAMSANEWCWGMGM